MIAKRSPPWKIDQSLRVYQRGLKVMPGAASSNTRTYPMFEPHPIYMRRGEGSRFWDVDGNEYLDYIGGFGALILGHRHPATLAALSEAAATGTMLAAPTEREIEAAEMLTRMVPSLERVRFAMSGTEANTYAIRLARAYTGKDKIIKFEGGFHGVSDYTWVSHQPPPGSWGSRVSPYKVPLSAGVPPQVMDTVIVVPWNDVDALESTVKRHANEVAAIITEPIMGNAGCFAPKDGFLGSLQKIARENEILTIFDEVVTGFRTALGSAQEMYGVRGDLSTFGKALGGGLPCAVYGGRAEILKEVEEMERGDQGVIGTGTFNGNSISVLGALSTMKELKRIGKKGYDQFHRRGQRLVEGIRRAAKSTGHSVVVLGFFGFFTIFFSDKESLDDYREARLHGDFGKYTRFAWQLYKRGVYVGPESWERLSMSLVHSDADVDQTIERFREAFRAL